MLSNHILFNNFNLHLVLNFYKPPMISSYQRTNQGPSTLSGSTSFLHLHLQIGANPISPHQEGAKPSFISTQTQHQHSGPPEH